MNSREDAAVNLSLHFPQERGLATRVAIALISLLGFLFVTPGALAQGTLTVTKNDSGPVIAGNNVTYTITLQLQGEVSV